MTLEELIKTRICFLVARDPSKGITYAWWSSMILVVASFICACFAASKLRGGGSGNDAAGFAAVWTALLLVAISIAGSYIMRKYRSPIAIGAFLGVVVVMNFQMLILFAVFVSHSQVETDPKSASAQQAVATFAFFLFLIYGSFGAMLYLFKDSIIKTENFDNEGSAQQLPESYS